MALKIKKGAVIDAYGPNTTPFTSESELSQPILAHLKTRFPEDIEGEMDAEHKTAPKSIAKADAPPSKYDGKTVAELKELAKDLEGYVNKMTKQELLDLLENADKAAAVAAEAAKGEDSNKEADFV